MTATLPQLRSPLFITDGGLETTIIFQQGVDLPDFAAFVLLDTDDGRAALRQYYEPYFELADRAGVGIVVDTPTWRANADWGQRLGYDADQLAGVNRRSVEFVTALAKEHSRVEAVIDGTIGPRGDGYVVEAKMTADEAADYHELQARAFAEAGAQMITAVTMTYAEEAIGIARAGAAVGLPVVISFTVETDGSLPSGQTLADAISTVDDATDAGPAYYMINCAHPEHFEGALTNEPWLDRVRAIRANASRMSHAELDEAEELDRGDIADLATHYRTLQSMLPSLCVVGGCCGTDHEHIAAIVDEIVT